MSEELKQKLLELLKDREFLRALAEALKDYFATKDELTDLRDALDELRDELTERIESLAKKS